MGSLFSTVWLRANFTSIEYSISELENKRMEHLREAKMLMAERASILSMQRVEKTAIKKLGLTFPNRTRVVHVQGVQAGPQRASFEERQQDVQDRKNLREYTMLNALPAKKTVHKSTAR